MGKQVIDLRPQKGMSRSQSNEHLRNFSEEAYRKKRTGNFDPTREHLNFEVGRGGKVVPVDKLLSIPERIHNSLKLRGIVDPNERLIKAGLEPKYRTVASFILGGSTEDMRRLAFGEQNVDFDKDNNPDNSWAVRQKGIEDWAVDVYNFMAKKYGEDNIVAFVVHLDEKNPHVHCTVLPVTEDNKISYNKVICGGSHNKYGSGDLFRQLHSEFAEVNKKYGLNRGDDTRTTGAKHKEYNEYLHEENMKKKAENDQLDKNISDKKETSKSLDEQIKQQRTKLRGLNTMLFNLEKVKGDLTKEIEDLESQRDQIKGDTTKIDMQINQLKNKLKDTEDKIEERKKMIEEAQKQYDLLQDKIKEDKVTQEELRTRIHESQNELQRIANKRFDMKEQLTKEQGDAIEKVKKDMEGIGWQAAALDAEKRFSMLSQKKEDWTPEQRSFFDNQLSTLFEGSFLHLIGEKGNEIVQNATGLFLGLITPSSSGGGGGGGARSGLRWDGRKEKENEDDFKLRCFAMGIQMAKGSGKKKKQNISY